MISKRRTVAQCGSVILSGTLLRARSLLCRRGATAVSVMQGTCDAGYFSSNCVQERAAGAAGADDGDAADSFRQLLLLLNML